MQKEIENLEFVEGLNFQFIDSLKNESTKYLLFFDDSCGAICNSKASVDIATARTHRVLSTIYMKHNLFHQSKFEQDLELQSTHIRLFKSPRDVTQISTLSAQLRLGSELADWYQHATSVPYSHLLMGLSSRTDNRLRFRTNTASIPSKFFYPRPAETNKIFGRWTHKVSLHSECSNCFPASAKVLSFSLVQNVYPLSVRMESTYAQKNLQRIKRHLKTTSHSNFRVVSPN